jgi:poly(3-hydroxyalkanoate) depolymerase
MSTPDHAASQLSFLHTGRHRVRVHTTGSGPPLLLLMGIGGNAEMWDPLRRSLPNRRLIAFDVPGTGESSTPWIPMTMFEIAGTARAVMRHVGVERTDVLGVSWGGVLAQIFAIRHASAVRRLVLAATSVGVGSILGRPSALWILSTPRRYYSQRYFEKVAPTLYGGRIRSEPGVFAQQATARLARPPTLRGYAGQVFAIATTSSLPCVRRITSPVLVITGTDDALVPSINSRMLQKLLPNATLHLIQGGGHLFLLESADEVAPVIDDFLGREH